MANKKPIEEVFMENLGNEPGSHSEVAEKSEPDTNEALQKEIEEQKRLIKGLEELVLEKNDVITGLEAKIQKLETETLDPAVKERLVWEAQHDELTKLMNRKGCREMIEGPINPQDGQRSGGNLDKYLTAKREIEAKGIEWNKEYVVMLVDLDHLKQLNDQYGHETGDRAFVILAKVLDHFVRDRDVVARWGGDEFIVQMTTRNEGDRVRVATRLLNAIRELKIPVTETIGGKEVGRMIDITSSIGVAKLNKDESFDALIKRADQAVYKAKDAGRDTIAIPDDEE